MKKTNSKKIEQFIRVDHAGERGCKNLRRSTLSLKTIYKDSNLEKTIEEMKIHEIKHKNYFEEEIKKEILNPLSCCQFGIFRCWTWIWLNYIGLHCFSGRSYR